MSLTLIQRLNAAIKRNSSSFNPNGSKSLNDQVYNHSSGDGLMARNLVDGIQNRTSNQIYNPKTKKGDVYPPSKLPLASNYGALPATLLHNNLVAPNKVYPFQANISKPNSKTAGKDWNAPTLVAIKGVNTVIPGFTTAKTQTWNRGVFYAHDSNSVDQRTYAYWNTQKTGEPDGFKAPHAYYKRAANKKSWAWINDALVAGSDYWQNGAGSKNSSLVLGNPTYTKALLGNSLSAAIKGAYGAGFHTNSNYYSLHDGSKQSWSANHGDLIDAIRDNASSKKGGKGLWSKSENKYLGQINEWWRTGTKYRWDGFYQVMKNYIKPTFGLVNGGINNQGYIDSLLPWVTNPQDLINISNRLWLDKGKMFNPKMGLTDGWYWGWNEIPTHFSSWNTRQGLSGFSFILPYQIGGKVGTESYLNSLNKSNSAWRAGIASQISNYLKLRDPKGAPLLKVGDAITFALTTKDKYGYSLKFVNPQSFSFKINGHTYSISGTGILGKENYSQEKTENSINITFSEKSKYGEQLLGSVIFDFDVNQNAGENTMISYVDESLKKADAAYSNIGGLYRVVDENGSVQDIYDLNNNGETDDSIAPGHAGYYITALSQWEHLTGLKSGSNKTYDTVTGTSTGEMGFSPDQFYAPFLIANGGKLLSNSEQLYDVFEDIISANPLNTRAKENSEGIVTYFAFREANPDRMDHVMQQSNGSIGWEDQDRLGNTDNDFNDSIFHYEVIG